MEDSTYRLLDVACGKSHWAKDKGQHTLTTYSVVGYNPVFCEIRFECGSLGWSIQNGADQSLTEEAGLDMIADSQAKQIVGLPVGVYEQNTQDLKLLACSNKKQFSKIVGFDYKSHVRELQFFRFCINICIIQIYWFFWWLISTGSICIQVKSGSGFKICYYSNALQILTTAWNFCVAYSRLSICEPIWRSNTTNHYITRTISTQQSASIQTMIGIIGTFILFQKWTFSLKHTSDWSMHAFHYITNKI